jgi:hypothetical protein
VEGESVNPTRRGFLAMLTASPLLAKLSISNVIPEEFTLEAFIKKCLAAPDGDVFLVSKELYEKVWDSLGFKDRYLFADWANRGFEHLAFHGKPVIPYWPEEKEEMCRMISEHSQKGRVNITEIRA